MRRLVLALALAACAPVEERAPQIALDREPVALASAWVGTRQQQTVQLVNVGDAPLTVTAVSLAGGSAWSNAEVSPPLPATLAPKEAAFVRFSFAPTDAGPAQAKLVVESDAQERPRIETSVTACGIRTDGSGC